MKGTYEITTVVYDGTASHAYDVHDRAYSFQVNAGGTREMYGLVAIPAEWSHRAADALDLPPALNPEPALPLVNSSR
jgi:hypothetical protein